ncbi:MAG: gamma-glutamyltransferase, partial [Chloroflexi bacterium]|nr:gamma-glutamyltransferase [Chloroflexota bacterium]
YRAPAIGRSGVVAAAHGLAATAGLRVLFAGGTAVDAAVAVGAALGVVEPFMSGIGGGGGCMLIYEAATRRVHALDYLGPAPRAATASAFSSIDDIDMDVRSATVPSLVAGWLSAHERFGRLERQALFAPAIELAENGWPVSPWSAGIFSTYAARLERHPERGGALLPDGEAPAAGSVMVQPELARSYRQIADGGADAFYRGAVGRSLVQAVQSAGGWLSEADLAKYAPTWREPLAVEYRDWRVHCSPPPSSGFQYLECLNMLAATDLSSMEHNSAEYLHLLLETIKLASADRTHYASAEPAILAELLSQEYAADRRQLLDPRCAAVSEGERFVVSGNGSIAAGVPRGAEHTTHFEVADRWGNLVSVTQSNGAPFGSGFVAGDTGIVLNNFLYWTDLEPSSPNFLRPGQQQRDMPMAPCIVTRDGALRLGIGTPGSYGILQTTLQMVLNSLDFGMHVQAAIEAPRVRAFEGTRVMVEGRIEPEVVMELRALGHDVQLMEDWTWAVGGGHGIQVDAERGVLSGGADPRRDGAAVAL